MEDGPRLNSDAWVDQYGDALFHFALARVKNRETAEDLVQETFLAAVKSQKRFKGHSSLSMFSRLAPPKRRCVCL